MLSSSLFTVYPSIVSELKLLLVDLSVVVFVLVVVLSTGFSVLATTVTVFEPDKLIVFPSSEVASPVNVTVTVP